VHYIDGEASDVGDDWIVDDLGTPGGLRDGALFVVMGDQNSRPDQEMARILGHPRVQERDVAVPRLPVTDHYRDRFPSVEDDSTFEGGGRIDYVVPSIPIETTGAGIYRPDWFATRRNRPKYSADTQMISDHFPVWVDVVVPPRDAR